MLPVIDYLNVNEIVEEQKKVIYREVQNVANQTHSVFPGLQFTPGQKLDPRSIPGLGTGVHGTLDSRSPRFIRSRRSLPQWKLAGSQRWDALSSRRIRSTHYCASSSAICKVRHGLGPSSSPWIPTLFQSTTT